MSTPTTPSTPMDPATEGMDMSELRRENSRLMQRILERTRMRRAALDAELGGEEGAKLAANAQAKEDGPSGQRLERSESGGTKRTSDQATAAPLKRTPSSEAPSTVVLRPHNSGQAGGGRAQDEARRRSKFSTLARQLDDFEVDMGHAHTHAALHKPQTKAQPKAASPEKAPRDWAQRTQPAPPAPAPPAAAQPSGQPSVVASRVRAAVQVRFNEEVMSKTISTCPSTTDTRPSLDETLETVSEARVGDVSADASSSADQAQASALSAAGIETFFRPKPTAQAKALNRTPSGLETFMRPRVVESVESVGEVGEVGEDSLDESAAAATAAIDQVAREAGFTDARPLGPDEDELPTPPPPDPLSLHAAMPLPSPSTQPTPPSTPDTARSLLPSPPSPPSIRLPTPRVAKPLSTASSSCSILSLSSPPASLLQRKAKKAKAAKGLVCFCICGGNRNSSSESSEGSGAEEGGRSRVGSLGDRIAAFQSKANTSYRIPKPVLPRHAEPFYKAPSMEALASQKRPHEEWLVKGTARTQRVEPTKEMGLADDERRQKVSSLRSRWEVSSASGNTLMPEQDDSAILRSAHSQTKVHHPHHPLQHRPTLTTSTPDRPALRHGGGGPWAPSQQPPPQPAEPFDEEPSSISVPDSDTRGLLDGPTGEDSTQDQLSDADDAERPESQESDEDSDDACLDEALDDDDETAEESLPPPPPPVPAHTHQPEAPNTPLMHSVSFYRNMQKAARSTATAPRIVIRDVSGSASEATGDSSKMDSQNSEESGHKAAKARRASEEKVEDKLQRLQGLVRVKQEQIAQASHALNLCRSTPGFRGSREEVESQAILLIKTEERKAILTEMDRLTRLDRRPSAQSGQPKGTLTIGKLSFPLKREFINDNCNFASSASLHYFILLIKHREDVHETQMVHTDEALKSGALEFQNYITMKGLEPEFKLKLELYALRTTREQFSHEEKYRLDKKGTLKGRPKGYQTGSPAGPLAILDPSFQPVGSVEVGLGSVGRTKFQLDGVQFSSPVEGSMRAFVRVAAESAGTVERRGWLNAYEEVGGQGAWSRLYAVLRNGSLRFWKYQDQLHDKAPLNEVDLASCRNSEIRLCSTELCTRPHSFYLDVVCQTDPADLGRLERFRIVLAVDQDPGAAAQARDWVAALNQALSALRLWDPKRAA